MSRSFPIAAYLALNRAPERDGLGPAAPPRPKGQVIWARCANADQLMTVQTLRQKFADDGEQVELISTHPDGDGPHPSGSKSVREFLRYWQPDLVLWLDTVLDPATVQAVAQAGVPSMLLQAGAEQLDQSEGRRFPRLYAALLDSFDEIHCLTSDSRNRLIRSGAPENRTIVTGKLEETIVPAPFDETTRAAMALALGTRPLWLAVRVPMPELRHVAAAHRSAVRRSHRTLMILRPRKLADAPEMFETLKRDGFHVVRRSDGGMPDDSTQIYLADTEEGLGLWSRIAPMTYLGGSLSDGDLPDPFQPATVGSAIICGPTRRTHTYQINRLSTARAIKEVSSVTALAPAVESLIATDAVAKLAHAAWDVTSRGAEETDELVKMIYDRLDGAAGAPNARS